MGKGKWILRVIQSGPVIEKVLFQKGYPCLLDGITPVQGGTSAKKRLQNEYAAEKALARLLNANFAEGDSFGTLTYSQPGLKKLKQSIPGLTFKSNKGIRLDDHMKLWLAADKQLRNVLDSARRECLQKGIPIRYIAVTSDLKRVSNRRVRIHHHVIANPEAWKVIKKKWDKKWGRPHTKRLRKEKDYLSAAIYFLKQVRHDIPHQHRYISSRNLIRPQPIDHIAYSGMVLNTPKDCELLSSTALIPGMPQYARYLMPSDP